LDFFSRVEHGVAACGNALERHERVIVEDVTDSAIFKDKPALDVLLASGVRAVQSTPLVSRSGRILGIFSTHYSTAPRKPAARDVRLLDLLARQAADLIERDLAEQAQRESEAWMAGQKEAFQAAVNGAPLAKSLDILVRTALEQAGGDARCAFYIAD